MKGKLILLVVPVLLLFTDATTAKRHTRKSEGQLSEQQKQYLEKIQVLAREGGLPEEEWKSITKFDSDVCYEIDCLESALEVMTATNFTVNPCNHATWLNFVCTRRVSGPDNRNQPESLMQAVDIQTKQLLEDESGKLDDEFLLKEAQTYYHQCRNKGKDDDKDVKTILNYMSKNYGNWPIFTNRDPGEKFEWSEMVADLNKIERVGFKPLIFEVSVPASGNKIKLGIGQTNFAISGVDFNAMMSRVQKHSGSKKPYRTEQLEDTASYFNSLYSSTIKPSSPKQMSLEQLDQKTKQYFSKGGHSEPNISWMKFFKRIFDGSDIEISSSTVVNMPFDNVMSVLEATKEADQRAVANALNFQLATQLLLESTELLDDLNTFKCTELNQPRETFCLNTVKEVFGYSLGTTYLNVYYNDAVNTPAIEALMSKIQLGYKDVIDDTAWMEDSTKNFLKDKIQSMKTFITKPDSLRQPGALENFYSGLKASQDKSSSYPMNFLAINNWTVMKKRSHPYNTAKIEASGGKTDIYDAEWSRYLGNVQAQFHKGINEARIEGGIVQKPLFGVNRPGFMNFGGLGMVLAHEVGHSYDTQGRTYDKHGNEGEYWDKTSKQKYDDWVDSIIRDSGSVAYQTSETSAETLTNPYKTINEDISDILGVQISFLSYQEYLKELEEHGKKEKLLPGLKSYTPQKLFFMKYANMWCDNKDVQSNYKDMQSDHSAGNTRATLPLKRSKQFAETFGCKVPKQF